MDREFIVKFRSTIPSINAVAALRAVVNFASGRFGLRVIDAHEILPGGRQTGAIGQIAKATDAHEIFSGVPGEAMRQIAEEDA